MRRLAPLGRRLDHVLAVAEQARTIGPPTVGDASAMLVTAALLHDIGYAPEFATTGFHPLDGARFCRAEGLPEIAVLVAHHTGARREAALRGLLPELLNEFPYRDSLIQRALTSCDRTTGPDGTRMTVEIRVVEDIRASLEQQGIRKLVLVNGHGGNYVLGNVVQEANVGEPRMALFPQRDDWELARQAAGMVTNNHEDMHGGELEVSMLLAAAPELVREIEPSDDHIASERTHMHVQGMAGYTDSGIIGRPSLGDATKGKLALEELANAFERHLDLLIDQ
jgi:hypothetical protein